MRLAEAVLQRGIPSNQGDLAKVVLARYLQSQIMDEDTKSRLGIGQPRVNPPAPEFMNQRKPGYNPPRIDSYKEFIPDDPYVPKPLQDPDYQTLVERGEAPRTGGPYTTYIGPNAKGWNDTDEGKFSSLADRKMRQEISDEYARPKKSLSHYEKGDTIGDLLSHDRLFAQYPDLEKTPVDIFENILFARGHFDPSTKRLGLHGAMMGPEMVSTALHELQHGIQDKEGFASGGSPDAVSTTEFGKDYTPEISGRMSAIERMKKSITVSKDPKMIMQLEANIKQFENEISLMVHKMEQQSKTNDPFYDYQRLSGEVEARDVQSRKDMSDALRAKTMPYSLQGIPVNRQIVRFR